MSKEALINNLIKKEKVNTNLISDGYHTFGELYEHRITLFITLVRMLKHLTSSPDYVWRTKTDPDWFVLGVGSKAGEQITYHLPMSKWEETNFAFELSQEQRPKYDGHTSKDVLDRLNKLLTQ